MPDAMIEPVTPQATAATVEPTSPTSSTSPTAQPPVDKEAAADLPEELLAIPAIQAVLAGTPPATSMPIKGADNRDEVKLIADNKEPLIEAGMGFYRSLSGQLGVMFNSLRIHPDDLVAADKTGTLPSVAPDFDALNQELGKSGRNHPLLNANLPPAAPASPVSALRPPQAASGAMPQAQATPGARIPPPPASVARKLAAQRVLNLRAGSPTSGPAPGAGRLTNQVLQPAM